MLQMRDVAMVLIILIVVMLAYGTIAQSLQYPNRDFSWGIFSDIFYYPFWQWYGELELGRSNEGQLVSQLHCRLQSVTTIILHIFSDTGKISGCDKGALINTETGAACPRPSSLVTIMLACYLLIGHILLINLLIAIFS